MAGPGGGPSRRSHTKSRKGCKTCKRRHIRCDETFPQCRNCTKHQVRCDYMEQAATPSRTSTTSSTAPSISSTEQQIDLFWTPEIEQAITRWQQNGKFPFPRLNVFPQPDWRTFTATELRLIFHVAHISSNISLNGCSDLTIWTSHMPKFLGLAATHSFVMHAIFSFAAGHLSWLSKNAGMKNLAFQYGGTAFQGLHLAIGNFSADNADAIFAASILLSWQATDWKGWSSLVSGTRTVLSATQAINYRSPLCDSLVDLNLLAEPQTSDAIKLTLPALRQQKHESLARLELRLKQVQSHLQNREAETKWVEQLQDYSSKLRQSAPPETPEEQFNYLYALRKWLHWVPIQLLQSRPADMHILVVLSYFYASALEVGLMFPELDRVFLDVSQHPLEEAIRMAQEMTNTDKNSAQLWACMDWPQQVLANYKTRVPAPSPGAHFTQPQQPNVELASPLDYFDHDQFYSVAAGSIAGRSPGFPPTLPSGSFATSSPPLLSTSYLNIPVSQQMSGDVDPIASISGGSSTQYSTPFSSPETSHLSMQSGYGHDFLSDYMGVEAPSLLGALDTGFVKPPTTQALWT